MGGTTQRALTRTATGTTLECWSPTLDLLVPAHVYAHWLSLLGSPLSLTTLTHSLCSDSVAVARNGPVLRIWVILDRYLGLNLDYTQFTI